MFLVVENTSFVTEIFGDKRSSFGGKKVSPKISITETSTFNLIRCQNENKLSPKYFRVKF